MALYFKLDLSIDFNFKKFLNIQKGAYNIIEIYLKYMFKRYTLEFRIVIKMYKSDFETFTTFSRSNFSG